MQLGVHELLSCYHAIWFPCTCSMCMANAYENQDRWNIENMFWAEPKCAEQSNNSGKKNTITSKWRREMCTTMIDRITQNREQAKFEKTKQLMPYHWICRWHAMFHLLLLFHACYFFVYICIFWCCVCVLSACMHVLPFFWACMKHRHLFTLFELYATQDRNEKKEKATKKILCYFCYWVKSV